MGVWIYICAEKGFAPDPKFKLRTIKKPAASVASAALETKEKPGKTKAGKTAKPKSGDEPTEEDSKPKRKAAKGEDTSKKSKK